jgi:hypothetical protein
MIYRMYSPLCYITAEINRQCAFCASSWPIKELRVFIYNFGLLLFHFFLEQGYDKWSKFELTVTNQIKLNYLSVSNIIQKYSILNVKILQHNEYMFIYYHFYSLKVMENKFIQIWIYYGFNLNSSSFLPTEIVIHFGQVYQTCGVSHVCFS